MLSFKTLYLKINTQSVFDFFFNLSAKNNAKNHGKGEGDLGGNNHGWKLVLKPPTTFFEMIPIDLKFEIL
jgi:hypothetical protein